MIRVQVAGGPRSGRTEGAGAPLRIAILGDSSAAGFGAPDHASALAGQLAEALARRIDRPVSWRVTARGGARARTAVSLLPGLTAPGTASPGPAARGTTTPGAAAPGTTTPGPAAPGTTTPGPPAPGLTTPDLTASSRPADRAADDQVAGQDRGDGWRPEIVLVVVGVNDTTRFRRPAAFGQDVERLVSAIRDHLGTTEPVPVLLAGLPPMHRFPGLPKPVRLVLGRHARRLDRQLAALAGRIPATHHLPVGELALDEPGLFAEDGFHPAPAAYRVWGDLLAEQAAPLLR